MVDTLTEQKSRGPSSTEALSLPEDADRYRAGTLTYTRMGLITLFLWLLWGDFCFTLMETVIPTVLPLKLRSLGAPNWLLGLFITTIPSSMNFMINPIVSFKSDRYRSKWGRRIPFLLFATPMLTLMLILMAFSDNLGRGLHRILSIWSGGLNPTTVILVLIGILLIGFQFFNMFVSSVYYYLFNDVVPKAYLARCMALFRVIGVGASSLYSLFIYRYAETHMREIFLGAAVLYFAAFMLMCWKVREGSYPPPPENVGGQTGFLASARTYMTECFTCRFFWYFFLSNAFWQVATCIGIFNVFLYRDSLGLTLNQLGKIGGIAGIVSTILLFPAGMLSDKIHPLRVMVGAKFLITLMAPAALIYLFFDFTPPQVLKIAIVLACITLPMNVMYTAAALPMYMSLLPKERYGQFCSADAMVRSISAILGGVFAGGFMDLMKTIYHGDIFYYRYIPLWTVSFEAISLVFLLLLYRGWKQHGGMKNYVPPTGREPS
ncbi:MAG: MFS transporter [Phycisphaerae bacterium]